MHEFEQLGAGLLFGRVDVLIALDDIDVDGELTSLLGEQLLAGRDLRIALGAQAP